MITVAEAGKMFNGVPLNQITTAQPTEENTAAATKNSGKEPKKFIILWPKIIIKQTAATAKVITPNGNPENKSKIAPPANNGHGEVLSRTAKNARLTSKGRASEKL